MSPLFILEVSKPDKQEPHPNLDHISLATYYLQYVKLFCRSQKLTIVSPVFSAAGAGDVGPSVTPDIVPEIA